MTCHLFDTGTFTKSEPTYLGTYFSESNVDIFMKAHPKVLFVKVNDCAMTLIQFSALKVNNYLHVVYWNTLPYLIFCEVSDSYIYVDGFRCCAMVSEHCHRLTEGAPQKDCLLWLICCMGMCQSLRIILPCFLLKSCVFHLKINCLITSLRTDRNTQCYITCISICFTHDTNVLCDSSIIWFVHIVLLQCYQIWS